MNSLNPGRNLIAFCSDEQATLTLVCGRRTSVQLNLVDCESRLAAPPVRFSPVYARFVRAFAEAVDWMYSSDPKVVTAYEAFSKTPRRFVEKLRSEF